ncbi:MAG: ATP-binding protein [Desulfobacterales bacterium]|nr:ATP-binding protein [Desulfobacterales bacterium]
MAELKTIRGIFTSGDLEIGEMSIKIKDEDISKASVDWSDFTQFGFKGSEIAGDERIRICIQFLSKMLSVGEIGHPVYLPASRTGFMLSYKSLIASLMEGWGLDKKVKSDFTRPIIDFLKTLLVDINREDFHAERYRDIAYSLEKEILEGRIEQASDPGVGFYYQPELTKKSLPFHLTSSLVSELAPLIISLKGMVFNTLIFEEPESHLHLNAQRILAKYLVKLVNNGMPVWITTHSDIFFQQINNLIASNEQRINKLGELSYKDDEMIKPGDIEAYQFNINKEGMTEVVPLEKTEDGFIVPTFNQTVMELSKETVNLETENAD